MNKRMCEIRHLLGTEYHLCESYGQQEWEWKLYKMYRDPAVYYSNENKPIMTSKDHSIDDLYKYAKEHHRLNEYEIIKKICTYIAVVMMVLAIANLFLKNNIIRGLVLGVDIMVIIIVSTFYTIRSKNQDIQMQETLEFFRRYNDESNKKVDS